jgi:branched-chain amino acid transport system permease protein
MLQAAIAGLADSGGAYAALAVCLVLLLRTTGVLNFAAAATGTFGTYVMSVLYTAGTPYAAAAVVGIIVGTALSIAFGLALTRWFFDATPAHRTTVTIALLIGTIAVALRIFGDFPRLMPNLVNGNAFRIASVDISNTDIVGLIFAFVITALVTQTLRRTEIGLRLRAISQGPVASELLALPVRSLSVGVWALAGAVSTVALLVITPDRSTEIADLSLLVVPAMAAALLASFSRYWVAVVGGLALGAAEGLLSYVQSLADYQAVIPFVVIVLLLLYFERKETWGEVR